MTLDEFMNTLTIKSDRDGYLTSSRRTAYPKISSQASGSEARGAREARGHHARILPAAGQVPVLVDWRQ